nr:hypothetical protein NCPCFENI_00783 [Cupriavidus sp.]
MKEISEKNGLADTREQGLGMSVAPGPFALDTIRSILAHHKAIRSAYFYFDGYRLMPQCNSLVSRASLMQQELTRRGLRFKRLMFSKAESADQTSPVGILVFSVDQQAARRLCAAFTPDSAFWCDRQGPEITLV